MYLVWFGWVVALNGACRLSISIKKSILGDLFEMRTGQGRRWISK